MKTNHSFSSTIRAAEYLSLSFVLLLAVATMLLPDTIPNATNVTVGFLKAAALFSLAIVIARALSPLYAFVLRIIALMWLHAYIFDAVAPAQLILTGQWFDEALLRFEHATFGFDFITAYHSVAHPWLTEWMMFAYVLYVPFLTLTALVCYKSGGEKAAYDYLLAFTLGNVLCFTGFLLYPLMGPTIFDPARYVAPLDGGVFTQLGEMMRSNLHYPGGSLPSPHCTLTTIILLFIRKYDRKLFALLAPALGMVYIATVYCLYHYIWDVFAGMLVGWLVFRWYGVVGAWFAAPRRAYVPAAQAPVHS